MSKPSTKISEMGINHLEAASMFKKPQASSHVNITNVQGVTIVGDGNLVNTKFTALASISMIWIRQWPTAGN